MKNIPLIMAASHTLARRLVVSCQYVALETLHGVCQIMMLVVAVFLFIAGLFSSSMLILVPIQVLAFFMKGKENPLFLECHESAYIHLGQPTALSLLIYMGVVSCIYSLGIAYAVQSGAVGIEQAKSGKGKNEALLSSMFNIASQAFEGYIHQISSGKFWGWDGLLAAPLRHGWKIALCCLAMPIHVLAVFAMLFKAAFKSLGNFVPKLTTIPTFGEVLERLAHESPDVLARHEARALNAQVDEGNERKAKTRL